MRIYNGIDELIGRTPLMALKRFSARMGLERPLLAKLERFNPAGSVKDRVAREMLDAAEADGRLKPGDVIIEPTSGNTGIGLAALAAARGYQLILTMPETMSAERRQLLKALGAKLVLTEGKLGMNGAIAKAEELAAATPGSFIAGQFTNPDNPAAHFKTTGPELWEDTDGDIGAFVAGVGTGGTITGTGGFLKSKNTSIKIVAVEPAGSPVLSGGKGGPHGLQGIGAGFIPTILDVSLIDEIVRVTDEDAFACGKLLARSEGIMAGITSGAALWAAAEVVRRGGVEGNVIALLPDTGDRYLSTAMFGD